MSQERAELCVPKLQQITVRNTMSKIEASSRVRNSLLCRKKLQRSLENFSESLVFQRKIKALKSGKNQK